jgi:hypothetical protein
MWQGAHGRLAAIAMLAGGLSGCATTPKPVHDDEPDDHTRFICGGNDPSPTTESLSADIVAKVRASCDAGATAGKRHGEVRISVRRRPDNRPWTETEQTPGLIDEDRLCAFGAAQQVLEASWQQSHGELFFYLGKDEVTFHVAVGTAPPLFGSAAAWINQWRAALQSTEARAQLEVQLPPGVTLADGCLSVTARPAFTDGLDRWLAMVDTPVDALWPPDDRVFTGLREPRDRSWMRVYLLTDRTLLVRRIAAMDGSRQEICLLPLDDGRWNELRAYADQRASCWAGDLREILLHPRTEFPADRRFKAVSSGAARVCALDEGGRPVCCGERVASEIPAGPFVAVAVGATFDCGLRVDGSMRCWGHAAPAGGADIAGPFAEVAAGKVGTCAVRRDTGALECWLRRTQFLPGLKPGSAITVAPKAVRAVTVMDKGVCAVLDDGRARCWGEDLGQGWSEVEGRFRRFAGSGNDMCGVTGAGDGVGCWRDHGQDTFRPPRAALVRLAEPIDIAMSGRDACVLLRSGRVACSGDARNRWPELYRALAGSGDRLCAVTIEGRVKCDHEWPSSAMRPTP